MAEAFWNAELEDELRKSGCTHKTFADSGSREELMREIDTIRAATIYPHKICSTECKKRGINY